MFDYETVKAALIDIANANPEKTALCLYQSSSGTPVCLVAQVVAKLEGVDAVNNLDEGRGAGAQNHLTAHYSQEAVYLLRSAQQVQDAGYPWGRAVSDAITESEGFVNG